MPYFAVWPSTTQQDFAGFDDAVAAVCSLLMHMQMGHMQNTYGGSIYFLISRNLDDLVGIDFIHSFRPTQGAAVSFVSSNAPSAD